MNISTNFCRAFYEEEAKKKIIRAKERGNQLEAIKFQADIRISCD